MEQLCMGSVVNPGILGIRSERCVGLINTAVPLKGSLTDFIGYCSLRSPNRLCNIGWAEDGPGAVLCTLMQPCEIALE